MSGIRRITEATANLRKAKSKAFTYARPILILTNELPQRMLETTSKAMAELRLYAGVADREEDICNRFG